MLRLSRRSLLATPVVAATLGACTATTTTRTVVQPAPSNVAVVTVEPPAPRYEAVVALPPDRAAREVWQPGHWRWEGREYGWVPGHYAVRPRPNANWVATRWERRGSGWVMIEGHWA